MTSYKINDALFLTNQTVSKTAAPKVEATTPTDHLFIIDCSGSMWGELSKIAQQLKDRLPKTLKEEDTLSIIWFSGRGQSGALLEGERVNTLADLETVKKQIDRWLKPIGLTGFKEPLLLVKDVVDKVNKKTGGKNRAFSLYFLTDGCDNQSTRPEIMKAVEEAGSKVSTTTFVEYGYYADRQLLTQMAEKCGGSLIFAETFDTYAPSIEAAVQKKVTGAPKIEVKIPGDPINGFAFALQAGDLLTFTVEGGAVKVPEDLGELWYVTPKAEGKAELIPTNRQGSAVEASYAALSLYAQRMNSNVVFAFLKSTGDVKYIEQFANCFGKQKYSDFTESTKVAAFDQSLRLTAGYDPNKIPPDDAFTVLDLLDVLSSDESNRILLDSKDFRYSKISRGRDDVNDVLTAEEQAEIAKLTAEMAQTKDAKKVKDLTAKIAAVTANKPAALKFEAEKLTDGYPISTLTYNENRPNISFLIRKEGTVDITSRKTDEKLKGLPDLFPTNIFRNYNVIKDGLVGLDRLPVRLTAGTIRDLKKKGMPMSIIQGVDGEEAAAAQARATKASDGRDVSVVFDLKQLPIINRKMVKEASAKSLFELEYSLLKAKAAQKVYNGYVKELFPKKSKGLAEQYSEDAAAALKDLGITDGGFNPKSVQAESTDVYMGKEMEIKIKGLSSLPSLKDVKAKMDAKPTPSIALMAPYVREVEAFIKNDVAKASDGNVVLERYLETKQKEARQTVRGLMYQMSQSKFAVLVGQIWFSEFKSMDENSLELTIDGQKLACSVVVSEVEIKL